MQLLPDPPTNAGAIVQLGERLLCKQEVAGSIPAGSTSHEPGQTPGRKPHAGAMLRLFCLAARPPAEQSFDRTVSQKSVLLFNNLENSLF